MDKSDPRSQFLFEKAFAAFDEFRSVRALTLVEDCLVPEDDNFKVAITLKTSQDLATGSAAGFDVACTDSDSPHGYLALGTRSVVLGGPSATEAPTRRN